MKNKTKNIQFSDIQIKTTTLSVSDLPQKETTCEQNQWIEDNSALVEEYLDL